MSAIYLLHLYLSFDKEKYGKLVKVEFTKKICSGATSIYVQF